MKNKINLSTITTTVFFFVAIIRITVPVYQNLYRFTEKFDPALYEKKYNASQYMIPQSKHPISDEELLSHAGYKYINGLNPILINSDHPPLGKYIIGLFTIIFQNNRIVSLFFALSNFILIFLVVFSLTHSKLLASLSLFFLSLDPMLIDQIIHSPILDIIQVSFLLLYIYLLSLWLKSERTLLLFFMGIALGCLSSIKLYFPAFVAIGVTGLALISYKKHVRIMFRYVFVILPVAFITYAGTYLRYFIEIKAFLPFFGVQKWIYLFWQNNSIDRSKTFANVLPLILQNRWRVWWGEKPYITYSGWSLVWPVFFVLSIISTIFFLYQLFVMKLDKKNQKDASFQIGIFLSYWFIVFLFYLCFIPISPRYLMMLYFPSYIQVVLFIHYCFTHEKNKH
ncbi:hypothetical protein A2334_04185 [Candidatus Roizmanbacteria bacterium RIFOXYB2_FULL_38_10]|uniref:Glycosyltransferase RgtA/B/C/D-like domain-containing protein n=1 Tax=Candidatus Roizmanbacteria bacterium RIFOXYD1_FULL_38_12 TaxID=1802093 RepID=A0A1F7KZM2_9BACT|nr:MAG: hypothetical protein A3K47_00295 [Candidatus Roizmanbacteria bacterium RIFOXYA2_FULL_38_14]OGK63241.1 MAG: hypothetical protein A3K27_00295 [Candidatus Roizmanbacteria bacterium RIFOXYA1_FULL_37_12]OGK65087.1 MAG: hypothetical protein A3K38_00295 [Candidatus Roizmanbacteria bacterium RIFOXYB1_FULL_40_23]OGK68641.1 MAG: hypothetical protein A2334_04185 [Candidatus Roizmanbacteria bacterium RIFOXYB2_FULL_38_10]OGK69491.1 MAG: hypothetical protein A3K21_00295 [Candidatus Roizmanbacteria ba